MGAYAGNPRKPTGFLRAGLSRKGAAGHLDSDPIATTRFSARPDRPDVQTCPMCTGFRLDAVVFPLNKTGA